MNQEPNRQEPFNDSAVTVERLRSMVAEFVDARDWRQFHSPKNLTMALAIEAAELMEHFQWVTPQASREIADDAEKLAAVGEEMADVLCYLLAIANELDLDISSTMAAKMKKNILKYPAEEFRGRYGPEDPGQE